MTFNTVDQIVSALLLKEGKPVHFYLQYLVHACDALKRLNTTTLRNVNSKKIPVTSYKAVPLPCDYVDYVLVGVEVGDRVRPLIYDNSITRLNNYDASGAKIVFPSQLPDGTVVSDIATTDSVDNTDEPYLNHDVSRDDYKFKILRERGEIQLSADFPYEYVILDYITDGLESDAATKVDPLAQAAIEKYILWQAAVHRRGASEGEKMAAESRFTSEWRLLRAAKSNLTKADIIHAIRSGYSGTY